MGVWHVNISKPLKRIVILVKEIILMNMQRFREENKQKNTSPIYSLNLFEHLSPVSLIYYDYIITF